MREGWEREGFEEIFERYSLFFRIRDRVLSTPRGLVLSRREEMAEGGITFVRGS